MRALALALVGLLILGCGGESVMEGATQQEATAGEQQACGLGVLLVQTASPDQCVQLLAVGAQGNGEPRFRLLGDTSCGVECLILQPGESAEVLRDGPVQFTTWPASCQDLPPCPPPP